MQTGGKRRATYSSETSVDFQQTTCRYTPEDSSAHNHCCENLKSYKFIDVSEERTASIFRIEAPILPPRLLLVTCLPYPLTLTKETVYSSEASVNIYPTTPRHIPEENPLYYIYSHEIPCTALTLKLQACFLVISVYL
jgi:hypothetical protein